MRYPRFADITAAFGLILFIICPAVLASDVSSVSLSASSYRVEENAGPVEITVHRSGNDEYPLEVAFEILPGSALNYEDYRGTLPLNSLVWATGDSRDRTFEITIFNDALDEGTETFSIALANANPAANFDGISSAEISIVDDERSCVSFNDSVFTVQERDDHAIIYLIRTGPPAGVVSVGYTTTIGGTAVAAEDYTSSSGRVEWADNEVGIKRFGIAILDDNLEEADETVFLELENVIGATLETPSSAVLTILDDDQRHLQFSANHYSVSEEAGSVEISVTRTGLSDQVVSVSYRAENGSATMSEDYQPATGTLLWDDGDMVDKTMTIDIVNDALAEGHEFLRIFLENPVGNVSVGSPNIAYLTIIDGEWNEVQLNTHTNDNQITPAVAMASDGRTTVVWNSHYQDGDSCGIYGQRFSSDGVAIGGEFLVNVATEGCQSSPDIAMTSSGAFVVAYRSQTPSAEIFVRRYNTEGVPIGNSFQVDNTSSPNSPSVALDDSGRFMAVWHGVRAGGDMDDIIACVYDANDTILAADIPVNTHTLLQQENASVAAFPGGGYVVVWESLAQGATSDGIFGRRFDASGAPIGDECRLSPVLWHDLEPSVVVGADNTVFVVWHTTGGKDGYGSGVYGRRFDPSLTALGDEFLINTYTDGDQEKAKVAIDGNDNVIVVWQSLIQDGSNEGVFCQEYRIDGSRIGYEFQANTTNVGSQYEPAVARAGNGDLAVVWTSSYQDGSGAGIYGAFRQ